MKRNQKKEDITNVLTMLYSEDTVINDLMVQFFKVGRAMFTTAIHFMVAQQLLSHPEGYASQLCTDDDRCKAFLSGRDLKDHERDADKNVHG